MANRLSIKALIAIATALWLIPMVSLPAFAEDAPAQRAKDATSVNNCKSQDIGGVLMTPSNCLFLEEPIGGKPGYDLYKVSCEKIDGKERCVTELWTGGGEITQPGVRGPIQAVLTRQAGKEAQGSLGLLYNYLSLIYNYMSGLIIGISVLFTVIGGIEMSIAGGDSGKFDQGKSRIVKAVTGIILWFTASLILYTINPTFFAF